LLFDSAFKLALGQASAVVLAAAFWWLGSRQGAGKGVAGVVKTI
jgi:DHA1 family bicyclomycin/chloramphenicol resistance-like MFS transporter